MHHAPAFVKKLPKPEFNVQDLTTRRPDGMVKALYFDQPHQFHEDGLRFRTLSLLQRHSVTYFERKKLLQKRKDNKESRLFREMYCKLSQWVTDFNALDRPVGGEHENNNPNGKPSGSLLLKQSPHLVNQQDQDENEEFIMPADEFFPRCPVSKERFESFWDDEEGELMYRHAVKVLVTASADGELFKMGRPCPAESSVHYLVVHKLLVLDKWLSDGKAIALKDLALRYEQVGQKGMMYVEKMKQAADGEDEEDIFVILDLTI